MTKPKLDTRHALLALQPARRLLVAGALLLSCALAPVADAAFEVPPASVEGGLDKPAVRAVVRENIDDVRYCYNDELIEDDSVAGYTVLEFVISTDGAVSRADVSESTMPARFDACLSAAVSSWSFPRAEAETSVSYPFEMSPG